MRAPTLPRDSPDLSTILKRLSPGHPEFLPSPQETTFAERFLIEREGVPRGRLHVSANPAFKLQEQIPVYMLTLTARGIPPSPDVEGVMSFFDEGRDLIVRSFRDMTTAEMHEKWGLRESV